MLFYTYFHFCCFTERKCTDLFALNLAFVCHLLHLGMWDQFPTYPHFPINQVDGSKWIHMFDLTLILHQMALLPLFHVPKYYTQKIAIKSSDKKNTGCSLLSVVFSEQRVKNNQNKLTCTHNRWIHMFDLTWILHQMAFLFQPSTFLGLERVTSL